MNDDANFRTYLIRMAADLMLENAKLREALQQVRYWYERDGSVGGCAAVIEDSVEPWTKGSR